MDQKSLSILNILFDNSSFPQSLYRLNRKADPCATNMAHPSLVSPIIGSVDRKSSSASKTKGYSQIYFRETTSISGEQFNETSGMTHLKKIFCLSRISETASQLFTVARKE